MQATSKRSGKRASFIEQARRAQLVAAAVETVNEMGYHGASLSSIGKRAGVAKSAIAYYFDSKEALLLSIVDEAWSSLGAAIAGAVPNDDDPAARLTAYADTYLAHVDSHRQVIAAAADIVVSHRGEDGVPLYLLTDDTDTALLRQILADGIASGAFRTLPVEIAVEIVESLLDRTISMVQRDGGVDLSTYRATVVPFLLSSLERDAS